MWAFFGTFVNVVMTPELSSCHGRRDTNCYHAICVSVVSSEVSNKIIQKNLKGGKKARMRMLQKKKNQRKKN